MVGRALCARLARSGASFSVLSRDPERARRLAPGAAGYHAWGPIEHGLPWVSVVDGARAVVHLAGPLTVSARWTDDHRRGLYDSCVAGTRGIVSAIAQSSRPAPVLVVASTVGYHPFDRTGLAEAAEDGPAGADYLSRLAVAWEAEAARAGTHGVRAVSLRFGLVLGREGALRSLARTARVLLGGPVPPGTQRQPWLHLDDAVGLLELAVADARAAGPINCVAPGTVTSAGFMEALRNLIGALPGLSRSEWLLHGRLGAGAVAVTHGRSAAAARLAALGYQFRQPRLEAALEDLLGPPH